MAQFSLVVATVGRTAELRRLLESLLDQTSLGEVIVVDQNPPGVLDPVLDPFDRRLPIIRLDSPRGLSRARNVGLKRATGDVVGFPDDDCWYPPGLLGKLSGFFESHEEYGGVTIRCLDEAGRVAASRSGDVSGPVTRWNLWYRGVSASMFFRRQVAENIGPFDEKMGIGSGTVLTSAEDIEYLARAVCAGWAVHYEASLHVLHPPRQPEATAAWTDRIEGQSNSVGYLLRKHRYPFYYVALYWIAGMARFAATLRLGAGNWRRYALADLRGRWRGWWRFKEIN